MTDEQLRAMARRVLGLALANVGSCGQHAYDEYAPRATRYHVANLEAASVAILREEMGKCPRCGSTEGEVLCMRCPPEKLEDINLPGFDGVVAEYPPAAETCRALYDLCPETIDAMRYDEELREVVLPNCHRAQCDT